MKTEGSSGAARGIHGSERKAARRVRWRWFAAATGVLFSAALVGQALAANETCFFPRDGTNPNFPFVPYSSSYCNNELTWPTTWTALDIAAEPLLDVTLNNHDLIGNPPSYPGLFVATGGSGLARHYLFFRVRVDSTSAVNQASGAPFNTGTLFWLMTPNNPNIAPASNVNPMFSVTWDMQTNLSRHGLEMQYESVGYGGDAGAWQDSRFSDVDGNSTSKLPLDIDGSSSGVADFTLREGYIRTVDSQPYLTASNVSGFSTFIDLAVSCSYFTRVAAATNLMKGFNPCIETERFYSTAVLATGLDDAAQWDSTILSKLDVFGVPQLTDGATILAAVWGKPFSPTVVVPSGIESRVADRGVEVTWQTASEVGTVGFNLYRVDPASGARVRVNHLLVPSLPGSPNGGTYTLHDQGASQVVASTYLLEEVEYRGARTQYGPFQVEPRRTVAEPGLVRTGEWRRSRRGDDPGGRQLMQAHASEEPRHFGVTPPKEGRGKRLHQPGRAGPAARVVVAQAGLQALTAEAVAAALGLPDRAARASIRERRLSLTGPEGPVACEAAADGSQLYFHGTPLDTTWSSIAVYWLEPGECRPFGREPAAPPRGGAGGPSLFTDRTHVEQDLIPTTTLFTDPIQDFWLWNFFVAGDPTMGSARYQVATPGATGGPGELTVRLQGASDLGIGRDHHVRLTLDGHALGDTSWAGATPVSASFTVPAGLLAADRVSTLEIQALLDDGLAYSVLALDSFDLAWERRARAVGDRLLLPRGTGGDLTVDGFTAGDVWALDLSAPGQPRRLTGLVTHAEAGSVATRFSVPAGSGPHLVLRPSAAFVPALEPVQARAPLATLGRHGADYLVITSQRLAPAAAQLAALREAEGLRTLLVTVEQIYDEYGGGNLDPAAIRAFLGHVHREWSHRPRFVVLAGSGTYDGRDLLGVGDNHVPPMLVETPYGIAPSDVALADVEGDDGVPEFAIGRIPAATELELLAYVDKLRARAADPGPWAGRALFVADDSDGGGDFAGDSLASIASLRGRYAVEEAFLAGDPAATRAQVAARLDGGIGLFHYFGHAGADRLAHEALLTSAGVDGLANGSRTPLALLMTCVAGTYGYPGYDGLGARLAKRAGGGAIATYSASAPELQAESRQLSQAILAALGGGRNRSIGEAVQRGLAASRDAGVPRQTLLTYNLFGDPAVVPPR